MTTPCTFSRIEDFTKGWFVGNFTPTLLATNDVEVAIKTYTRGEREGAHHHRVATEITAVISGRVAMLGRELGPGEVVLIPPGTSTAFEALEDSVTVVVKHPGANHDKYVDE